MADSRPSTIFPPDWHFAHRPAAVALLAGDLIACTPEVPRSEIALECANCYDHRFVYARKVERSGPVFWDDARRYHGRLQSAPCPVCRGEYLGQYLLELCGLADLEVDGKPAVDIRLADVSPLRGQDDAFRVARQLLAEIPTPTSWALFCGDYGRGKTHVVMGLVNGARVAGIYARYTTSEQILEALRSSYRDGSPVSTAEIRQRYERVPVLAVDELDRVKWTEWAGEQLFAILDARYLQSKATYFASNLGPKALAEVSEPLAALVSRISAGYMAVLAGPDFRPLMQQSLLDSPDEPEGDNPS